MGSTTRIEWADATWGPVTGCTEVSPGCDHCYAKTFAERWRGTPGHYFEQGFDVVLRPDKLDLPLRWKKPRRIFVNSMSDLFHAEVPDEFIARVFAVMALAPQHTFQVLTRRHGRMRSLLTSETFMQDLIQYVVAAEVHEGLTFDGDEYTLRSLPNVWLGVSVENQQWADIRIPALLDTPAAVRFLSCEPLLGPVDLSPWLTKHGRERAYRYHDTTCGAGQGGCFHPPCPCACHRLPDVQPDWVIVGGESGHGARPMHPEWARSLRDQCTTAGLPFLFKQWGGWAPVDEGRSGDVWLTPDLYPTLQPWRPGSAGAPAGKWDPAADVLMRQVGKKAAGRELDGRTWDEFPEAVTV